MRSKQLVLAMLLSAGLHVAAQNYTVATFSCPDPRTLATYGMGINDNGDVVGHYDFDVDKLPYRVGFERLADGTFQYPITDPNDATGQATYPAGIDDAGVIAGYYYGPVYFEGFLLSGGSYTNVDVQQGTNNFIYTIDNNGDFGGALGTGAAFVSIGGAVTQINVPGALSTQITGLASDGTTVGTTYLNGLHVSFVRGPNGKIRVFSVPKAGTTGLLGTYATAINEQAKLIVGYYFDALGMSHGFVYHYPHLLDAQDSSRPTESVPLVEHPDVVTVDVSTPGNANIYVQGVNASGVIVGTIQPFRGGSAGTPVGFIGTPLK